MASIAPLRRSDGSASPPVRHATARRRPRSASAASAWPDGEYNASATASAHDVRTVSSSTSSTGSVGDGGRALGGLSMDDRPRAREAADIWLTFRAADTGPQASAA